jgi:predicted Zn-dependent peptidase
MLPNGLLVVAEERPTTDTVAVQLMARAGSRDDGDLPGITLLTSRMMFQGTSRRPSETELQRAATAVGGSLSRGTTTEWSNYSSVMPSREADLAFDLIADVVGDPLFDPEALARQRQTALQEIAQRRANPDIVLDELFVATLFGDHPASGPVLGDPGSIRLVSPEDVAAQRERVWGAANLVLAVVGRIRPADALAKAEHYFGALPTGARNERTPMLPHAPDQETIITTPGGEQQAQFRVGYVAPGLLEADRYPLVVFNALMNGSTGRLFRSLRSARGLAYFAGSAYTSFTDVGAWYATAEVDPANVEQALQVTRDEIRQARDTMPNPAEVEQKISQIAGRQILADETNSARASRLASQRALGTESTDEYVRRIRQVTAADVQRVAQTYIHPERSVMIVVTPG